MPPAKRREAVRWLRETKGSVGLSAIDEAAVLRAGWWAALREPLRLSVQCLWYWLRPLRLSVQCLWYWLRPLLVGAAALSLTFVLPFGNATAQWWWHAALWKPMLELSAAPWISLALVVAGAAVGIISMLGGISSPRRANELSLSLMVLAAMVLQVPIVLSAPRGATTVVTQPDGNQVEFAVDGWVVLVGGLSEGMQGFGKKHDYRVEYLWPSRMEYLSTMKTVDELALWYSLGPRLGWETWTAPPSPPYVATNWAWPRLP